VTAIISVPPVWLHSTHLKNLEWCGFPFPVPIHVKIAFFLTVTFLTKTWLLDGTVYFKKLICNGNNYSKPLFVLVFMFYVFCNKLAATALNCLLSVLFICDHVDWLPRLLLLDWSIQIFKFIPSQWNHLLIHHCKIHPCMVDITKTCHFTFNIRNTEKVLQQHCFSILKITSHPKSLYVLVLS